MEIETSGYFNIKQNYFTIKQLQQFQSDSQTCLTRQQTFTVNENSFLIIGSGHSSIQFGQSPAHYMGEPQDLDYCSS